MKRQLRKITFTLLMIVLVVEPILQIVFNLNVSYAEETTTRVVRLKQGESPKLEKGESVIEKKDVYIYKIVYRVTFKTKTNFQSNVVLWLKKGDQVTAKIKGEDKTFTITKSNFEKTETANGSIVR